jgi:hypothetical protein
MVPTALAHHWESKADMFSAFSQLALSHLLGRHDVLEKLPHWLRVIIRRFITNPFIYQWLEYAKAQVQLKGAMLELSGQVLIECVFLG